MLNTPLEHHSSLSTTPDSLMLVIKASTLDECSSPDSPNLYEKVNKTFACLMVELLAVNLLFDCWFNYSSQTLLSPHVSNISDEIYRDLTYNRELIVNYSIWFCCHHFVYFVIASNQFDCVPTCSSSTCTYFIYFYSYCMFKRCCYVQFVYIKFTYFQFVCFFLLNLNLSNFLPINLYILLPRARCL